MMVGLCYIRYSSVNAPYKDYKIESIPVALNKAFETEDFRITYLSTNKKLIMKNDQKYVQYFIGVKMKNVTTGTLQYPSNKLMILASNYNYNQSFYFYNQDKKRISFNLKPNEETIGFLSFDMPYSWKITKDSPVKVVYFESIKERNKTIEYKLSF